MFKPNSNPIKKLKIVVLLFSFVFPIFASAQSNIFLDSAGSKIFENECGGKIFTKAGTMPSIGGGENALADSVLLYLKNRKISINGKAKFGFIVTVNSGIIGVEKLSGQISAEKSFTEALFACNHLWIPAIVNYRKVCAQTYLEAKFKGDKLLLKITQ